MSIAKGSPSGGGSELVHEESVGLPAREWSGVAARRPAAAKRTPAPRSAAALPNRYEIAAGDADRFLRCREAPGIAVRVDRTLTFSETEARKLDERVILLDGCGQFAPLVDDGKHLYNLDHHRGCLRAFTLATCEQALILVLQGLDLDKGDWTVYANQPDLDTVLAIWVLLNHRRVRQFSPEARDAIVPLLRLEGAIDANGLEVAEYCGLPQATLGREKERLDRLHAIELQSRQGGDWEGLDCAPYTLEMLLEIDKMVYRPSDFHDYASVETVYGHVAIGQDRVAVVCADPAGIYEVEKRLKSVWGDRLGLIALEREPRHFTLRRTAALAGIALEDAYTRLNLLDPAVDGRPPEKRWGGSDDIGGSPRPRGTGLTPQEIARILKLTYRQAKPWQRLQRLATAVLWTAVLALAAALPVLARRQLAEVVTVALASAQDLALAAAIAAGGAGLLIRRTSRGWIWLFGWRRPAARDWLALLPVVFLGAAAGGVWVPAVIASDLPSVAAAGGAVALSGLAGALWFSGLVHGLLILESRVQTVRGGWFLSLPALVAGGLYAGVTTAAWQLRIAAGPLPPDSPWSWIGVVGGALVVGVALAMIRERSLSVWPGWTALVAGGFGRVLLELWHR